MPFDYKKFEKWHTDNALKDNLGNPVRPLLEFRAEDHLKPGEAYFQKLSAAVQDTRDEQLNKVLQLLFDNNFRTVLVDWGEPHLCVSQNVYTAKQAFGKFPQIIGPEVFATAEPRYWETSWKPPVSLKAYNSHIRTQIHLDAAQTALSIAETEAGITPYNY